MKIQPSIRFNKLLFTILSIVNNTNKWNKNQIIYNRLKKNNNKHVLLKYLICKHVLFTYHNYF